MTSPTPAASAGPGSADGAPQEPRVVIADDQALVRTGFRLILNEAGIPVVAEAASGAEAVSAVLRHRPDVVLMDDLLAVKRHLRCHGTT